MLQVGVVEIHTYEYINVLCSTVHVFIYPSVGRVCVRACMHACVRMCVACIRHVSSRVCCLSAAIAGLSGMCNQ